MPALLMIFRRFPISSKFGFAGTMIREASILIIGIIIHQTRYEKSDWSRAFNQFTIAWELDMINAISAADIAFIMSSSKSAWLLSPLECSPQKQNGWKLPASVSEDELCEKCIIKQLLNSVFAWYHELSQPCVCVICLRFDNSWYHYQPHPVIV